MSLASAGITKFAQSFLLFSISLIVSLVIAEIVVRIFIPVYPSINMLDERYLYRYRPDSWKIYTLRPENGGGRIFVKINSKGFRGKEIDSDSSDPTIMVFGDSYIAAEYSDNANTFVAQLALAYHQYANSNVETMNIGTAAYGPDQESLRIEHELNTFNPDLVIFAVYSGNDFGDLMRNKIYRLAKGGNGLVENNFVIDASVRKDFTEAEQLFSDDKLLNKLMLVRAAKKVFWAWNHSRKLETVEDQEGISNYADEAASVRIKEYHNYIIEGNNVVTNLFGDGYDADISSDQDSESAKYKVDLMEQVILRVKHLASHADIPFLMLIIPSPIDVCENYDVQVTTSIYPMYKRTALTDLLVDIAIRHDIDYVNLFEEFHQDECNTYYLHAGNDHWSDRGQKLAAELVAKYIWSNKLIRGI